jgi:UDP-N-acetylglucosamine diphosphorylase / glucose-1-phosphate thymidylyltransferase / UDP-N-acetylgalactosamine diphosphorylase / glucosamine-1-phosphate N-acetyltransferase / galactosamine-1-phosphate N-acetyltransferase
MNNEILQQYVPGFDVAFPELFNTLPWTIVAEIPGLIQQKLGRLNDAYTIKDNIAIHHTAQIEEHVILKGPAIIGEHCFIGAHAYLRGGVFLATGTKVGPGCEIKSSIILQQAALAHFNFVGDSIIGARVNMEAGSVIANHYNERDDKHISILYEDKVHATNVTKFGALVGDDCRIGANAVLSPGTILAPKSIVKRLQLVEQVPYL